MLRVWKEQKQTYLKIYVTWYQPAESCLSSTSRKLFVINQQKAVCHQLPTQPPVSHLTAQYALLYQATNGTHRLVFVKFKLNLSSRFLCIFTLCSLLHILNYKVKETDICC